MTISLLCYLVAVVLFVLAALPGAKPWFLPIGLAFFTLGHCLAGVAFKAS